MLIPNVSHIITIIKLLLLIYNYQDDLLEYRETVADATYAHLLKRLGEDVRSLLLVDEDDDRRIKSSLENRQQLLPAIAYADIRNGARYRSNGIDIEVLRRHTVSVSNFQSIKVSTDDGMVRFQRYLRIPAWINPFNFLHGNCEYYFPNVIGSFSVYKLDLHWFWYRKVSNKLRCWPSSRGMEWVHCKCNRVRVRLL